MLESELDQPASTPTFRLLPTAPPATAPTPVGSSRVVVPTGSIRITARDAETGYGLAASVSVYTRSSGADDELQQPTEAMIGVWQLDRGGGKIELPEGDYNFKAWVEGYEPMVTHFGIAAGTEFAAVFWMNPLEVAMELRPEVVQSAHLPGHAMLHGYVVDVQSGEPLEGVRVGLQKRTASSLTNARGYFQLQVPSVPSTGSFRDPDDQLVAELAGYASYVEEEVYLGDGVITYLILLEPETDR